MSAAPEWLAALCAAPGSAFELPPGESERFARLCAEGWPLELTAGRVRFKSGSEPLDRIRLAAALAPSRVAVEVHAILDSTQDEARRRLAAGRQPPFLVLAEWQSHGRGRLGRRWCAPPMAAILATLVLPFARPLPSLAGLSPALGVALAEALARGGVPEIGLKWPNDLLRAGRKLGGLLVEALGAPGGAATVLIGFGLNASPAAASQAPVPAASLAAEGEVAADRNLWIPRLVRALLAALEAFGRAGFAPFAERYAGFDALRGHPVEAASGGRPLRGIAIGLREDGSLLLRCGHEVVAVATGEVSA